MTRSASGTASFARGGSDVRRPWVLPLVLLLVTAGIVVALLDSEPSGTGAENVGERGPEPPATTATATSARRR